MKKQLLVLVLFLMGSFLTLFGQEKTLLIPKSLQKKSIIWAAKVEFLVNIDITDSYRAEKVRDEFNLPSRYYCRTLKMMNVGDQHDYYYDEERYWAAHFVDTAWTNKMKFYKTENLMEQLTRGALDTILLRPTDCIGCNPTMDLDYDGPYHYDDPIYSGDIDFVKLSAWLFFDARLSQFQLIPIAMAPVLNRMDDNGNFLGRQSLYWMPISQIQAPINWNLSQITWGRRTASELFLEDLEVVKDDQKIAFETKLIKTLHKSKTKLEGLMDEPVYLHSQKDSFYLFHAQKLFFPESAEEVQPMLLDPKQIKKIRLVLDWTWDTEKQQFSVYCKGFLPIIKKYYEADKYNMRPIFYRKQ
ncbi:MAG: hypothetical protein GY810_01650 [Aureispira sp.]|nr:hypothetical protein [Aureispira sp.]